MSVHRKKRGQKFSQRIAKFSKTASESSQAHIKENLVSRLPHARNVRLLILEWSLLMAILILLAVVQVFWYSKSNATTAYTSGGTYTEATLGEIDSLNPLFATTNSEQTLSKLMFATLTANDYTGHSGIGLANSVVSDETGKQWTVHLRDDLRWSDGEPITNEDVIFTVHTIQDPDVNTSYSSNFTKVTVSEDEENNLVFNLPTAYANFSSALNIPILPKHILGEIEPEKLLDHEFSITKPVTSGAFSYNASQIIDSNTGEQIVYLSANSNFYGSKPMIDTFAIHSFVSIEKIIDAVNSGLVTATAELDPTYAETITSKNIYKKETTINNGVFAFMNLSSPTMSNKTLRQAIQKGINMSELRSSIGDEPDLNFPILDSQIQLSSYPELPTYDFDSAHETIAATDFDHETPISIVTVSTGYLPALANNLSEQLQKLGFKTSVMTYTPDQEFLSSVIRPRNYDILIYEVELGSDPDLFAYYHSSQATSTGLNLSNYRNSLVDDIILSARSTIDTSLRVSKYEAFLKYWVNDVPAIGIYQTNLAYYYNKNTRNFSETNHLAAATDRFCDVSYWSAVQTQLNRTP